MFCVRVCIIYEKKFNETILFAAKLAYIRNKKNLVSFFFTIWGACVCLFNLTHFLAINSNTQGRASVFPLGFFYVRNVRLNNNIIVVYARTYVRLLQMESSCFARTKCRRCEILHVPSIYI